MQQPSFWTKKLETLRRSSSEAPGIDEIHRARRRWEGEKVDSWIQKNPERRTEFTTSSGIPLKRIYTPEETTHLNYLEDIGFGGDYPFTRGVYPTMYRGRLWTMRMFSGFGAPEDTNERLKYLLNHGETGLSIAFDMPTLYGYDCDGPRAEGEVGRCGVSVSSLRDMEVIFDGVPLDQASTSMTINAPASVLTCMYIAVGEKQGVTMDRLRGTVQTDILKEFIAQKEWAYPPEAHMRIIRDMMRFCTAKMPLWNYISVSGYHIREAGASAIQELAFTLADGFAYVELGIESGLKVDEFAPRLSFFFNCDMDFFEEIAKFRAARKIWAQVMKERYGARDERSLLLRFHTQTSGASLTWQQPMNNIVRTTIEALAAVLGGTQSLHTNSYDEAWALPSEKAAKIALRTQQLIAEETGIASVVDPLGGSYYLEWLTSKMEEEAYRYFERIDKIGGVVEAIKSGFFQKEIAGTAYETMKRTEREDTSIVGVNKYVEEGQPPIETLKIDEGVKRRQIERLLEVKRSRDPRAVQKALARLKESYEDPDSDCMEPTLECVRAYATLGEIMDVGREVFGGWTEPPAM